MYKIIPYLNNCLISCTSGIGDILLLEPLHDSSLVDSDTSAIKIETTTLIFFLNLKCYHKVMIG